MHSQLSFCLASRSLPNLGSFTIVRIRRGKRFAFFLWNGRSVRWPYNAVLSKIISVHTCCLGIIINSAFIHSQKSSSWNGKLYGNPRKGNRGGWVWGKPANLRPINIREKYLGMLRVSEVFMHPQCEWTPMWRLLPWNTILPNQNFCSEIFLFRA